MDEETEEAVAAPPSLSPQPQLFDRESLPPTPLPRRRRALPALVVVALLAGGIGAALGASVGRHGAATPATRLPAAPRPSARSLAAVVSAVEPSVVDIRTVLAEGGAAAGTGIVLDQSGLVLTNNHVVLDAASVTVSVGNARSFAARVVGVDPAKDIALLQVDGLRGALTPAALGDSSRLSLGAPVVALGNALGKGGPPTPATGVLTAEDRSISASDELSPTDELLTGLLETDVDIEQGDSGGPLIDMQGKVIGMDTAMATEDGSDAVIGFAIPINEVRAIAREIRDGSRRGGIVFGMSSFLGVEFPPAGLAVPDAPKVAGAAIDGVVVGGPAATSGLDSGDVITALGGRPVTGQASLERLLSAYRPGAAVGIGFVDRSGRHTVKVILGSTVK